MKARRDALLSSRDAFAICELTAELYMKRWPGRARSDVSLDEFLLHIQGQFEPAKFELWQKRYGEPLERRRKENREAMERRGRVTCAMAFTIVNGRYLAVERFDDGTERSCDLGISVRDNEAMPRLVWPTEDEWKAGRRV